MGLTILRIPESMNVTPALNKALQTLLGDELIIERFSHEPKLFQSYQHRLTSLFEAFHFLCEAIPPGKILTQLGSYLEWCHQHSTLEPGLTAVQYQQKLRYFTTLLTDAIAALWHLNPDDAIERLDKAEQYLLLQKKRPQYATLTVTSPDSSNLILMVDKALPPFTKKTLDELKQIKASNRTNPSLTISEEDPSHTIMHLFESLDEDELDERINPHNNWFSYLPAAEKKLLYATLQKIDLDDPEAVFLLSSRLRTIPGLANAAQHQTHLINPITSEIKSFAPRLRSSHLGSRDIMKYATNIQELHTTRNVEQLCDHARQVNPSSSPRPVLIQTLISPMQLLNQWIPDPWLDEQRKHAIAHAITIKQPVFSTNHPFNYARGILYTPTNSPECLNIFRAAQEHLEIMQQRHEPEQQQYLRALEELISDYDKTLNSGTGTAWASDHHGRELFLSSLEDILISYIGGISYGSCVSGKDRKAIQLIHTDAMLCFHDQYGFWPKYADSRLSLNRKNFVRIFTQLYCSQHAQLFSGQNAPGSDGIKNPETYLTGDLIDAITSENLAQDDRLASNNEIEKIVSARDISASFPFCMVAAHDLPLPKVRILLNLISIIVREENFWASQTTPNVITSFLKIAASYMQESNLTRPDATPTHTMPATVTKIFNSLNLFDEDDPYKKLADIYDVIRRRDDKKYFRKQPTDRFYQIIEALTYGAEKPGELDNIYEKTLGELSELKQTIFEFNAATAAKALTQSQ